MAWSEQTPAPYQLLDDGFPPEACEVVVIGCGNILRGDDAAGPILIRQLYTRGVPDGVRLVDGGTAGMDVAFAMRGAERVVIVDAAATGAAPGTIYRVPASEIEDPPPMDGLHSHNFRWDHALSLAHWLLGPECPTDITVLLVEGESYEPGAPLSPVVDQAVGKIADLVVEHFPCDDDSLMTVTVTADGYLHLPAALAAHRFPADVLLARLAGDRLELMPVASVANGGLVLKQRNAAGDRSVLLNEVLEFADVSGSFPVVWDDSRGLLVVRIDGGTGDDRGDRDRDRARAGSVDRVPAGAHPGGDRATAGGLAPFEGAGRTGRADDPQDGGAPSSPEEGAR